MSHSRDNKKNEKKISPMHYAETALKKTRDMLSLGSSNISKLYYDKHTDKPITLRGLFSSFDSKRRLSLEALSLLELGIAKHFGIGEDLNSLSGFRMPQIRGDFGASNPYHHDDPNKSPWQNELDSALTMQAGHCHELALCALALLRHEGYEGRMEFIQFKYFRHVFVIINRPQESSLDDWKSWGNETIIIDPWINEVLRGDQFGQYWKEKIRIFLQEISRFNPEEVPAGLNILAVESLAENPLLEINPEEKLQFNPVKK